MSNHSAYRNGTSKLSVLQEIRNRFKGGNFYWNRSYYAGHGESSIWTSGKSHEHIRAPLSTAIWISFFHQTWINCVRVFIFIDIYMYISIHFDRHGFVHCETIRGQWSRKNSYLNIYISREIKIINGLCKCIIICLISFRINQFFSASDFIFFCDELKNLVIEYDFI